MNIVECSDIWIDDVFKWFHDHVMSSGGDGAAVICCENHAEAANLFIDWWRATILPVINASIEEHNKTAIFTGSPERSRRIHFYHPRHEYDVPDGEHVAHVINYHDGNENFMFSNRIIHLGFHDYTFHIKEDCKEIGHGQRILKAIQ